MKFINFKLKICPISKIIIVSSNHKQFCTFKSIRTDIFTANDCNKYFFLISCYTFITLF